VTLDTCWEDVLATHSCTSRAGRASFIDHLPKNRETRGKFAIASERKIGSCDVHPGFEMAVERHGTQVPTLT
jgi:hypothetical protein